MLLEGTGNSTTEVEGESFAFEEIRELAENEAATPGETFAATLTLQESLGEIIVEHGFTEFGTLAIGEDEKTRWAQVIEESGSLEVTASIWTSRNWEHDFYASVRVDLPSIEDAERQIEEDNRQYLLDTYGTETPTVEQVHRRTDEQLALSSNPETARKARERLNQADGLAQVPGTQEPRPAQTVSDWSALLKPDGTDRANLFQRGYARGVAGKATGDKRAPRIDYATVGQCKRIVAAFGGDVAEIDRRGGKILSGLWWVLLALLGLVAFAGLITPPGGWLITALIAWPFVHHFVTRRKLSGPFGPQPSITQ